MSAMDHEESNGICNWCHQWWPCEVAVTRQELADYLRDLPISNTGDPGYDCDRETGVRAAADAIDI